MLNLLNLDISSFQTTKFKQIHYIWSKSTHFAIFTTFLYKKSDKVLCKVTTSSSSSPSSSSSYHHHHHHHHHLITLGCCPCPIQWGWQHQATLNTGSPSIFILWVNPIQAIITDINFNTSRPIFSMPFFPSGFGKWKIWDRFDTGQHSVHVHTISVTRCEGLLYLYLSD